MVFHIKGLGKKMTEEDMSRAAKAHNISLDEFKKRLAESKSHS